MWAGPTKTNKESITWLSKDWVRCTSPALDWSWRLAAARDITTNTPGFTSHNLLSCNLPVRQQRASFSQALAKSIFLQPFMLSINITPRCSIKGGVHHKRRQLGQYPGKVWKYEQPNVHWEPHFQKMKSMYIKLDHIKFGNQNFHTSQIKLNINQCLRFKQMRDGFQLSRELESS